MIETYLYNIGIQTFSKSLFEEFLTFSTAVLFKIYVLYRFSKIHFLRINLFSKLLEEITLNNYPWKKSLINNNVSDTWISFFQWKAS